MRILLIFLIFTLGFVSILAWKDIKQTYLANKIAVSIYPFYDITKKIAGDKFEVVLILPPGADLHNYDLMPQDISKLKGVKLIFGTGLEIDNWVKTLTKIFPKARIVYLSENINLIENDPHFWLSIERMKMVAMKIADELKKEDPKNKDYYEKNLQIVLKQLDELLSLAKNELKDVSFRKIVVQHNGYNYMAEELGLEVVGYIESGSREITLAELGELLRIIKYNGIEVIFKEKGEENDILDTIAQELKLSVYELDSLEGKGGLDYFSAYKENIQTLKKALK